MVTDMRADSNVVRKSDEDVDFLPLIFLIHNVYTNTHDYTNRYPSLIQ